MMYDQVVVFFLQLWEIRHTQIWSSSHAVWWTRCTRTIHSQAQRQVSGEECDFTTVEWSVW